MIFYTNIYSKSYKTYNRTNIIWHVSKFDVDNYHLLFFKILINALDHKPVIFIVEDYSS